VDAALATLQAEIAKKEAGGESALMDLLIAYRHGDMFRLSRPGEARS
jgi:dimethylsulfide dehydrogenase subunit beta/complex iron-sulfur molybdoenzyme family reductase subunit beta